MADTVIEIPGIGLVAFPDTMTDSDISRHAKRLYEQQRVLPPHMRVQAADDARTEETPSRPSVIDVVNPGMRGSLHAAAAALRPVAEKVGEAIWEKSARAEFAKKPTATAKAITRIAPGLGAGFGGLAGWVVGEAITPTAKTADTWLQRGGSALNTLVRSPYARAATGVPGLALNASAAVNERLNSPENVEYLKAVVAARNEGQASPDEPSPGVTLADLWATTGIGDISPLHVEDLLYALVRREGSQ